MEAKSLRPLKIGVALGSGSARGWAHMGIMHRLAEQGIQPDIFVGASVGALVAAACASQQLADLESWVRTLTRVDVWRLLDATFHGGGVISGNRLMHAIGERIEDRRIEDLPLAFAAVAADLDTGQEIWLRQGPMLSAVRASSGLPGLFTPMWYQDRWMIDGGVVNPIPVSVCRALGADYVIAVNLNDPLGSRRRRPGPGHETVGRARRDVQKDRPRQVGAGEGWSHLSGLVDGLFEALKPHPREGFGLFEVMAASIDIMQDRITRSRLVGDPADVVISPNLGHFQLMDFHRADEAIKIGYAAVGGVIGQLEQLKG